MDKSILIELFRGYIDLLQRDVDMMEAGSLKIRVNSRDLTQERLQRSRERIVHLSSMVADFERLDA